MKVYFMGVEEYMLLAKHLADYLSVKLCRINEDGALTFKFDSDDVIYPNYFIEGHLIKLFDKTFVVAPHTKISKKWDNKIYQYQILSSVVPVPEYDIHKNVFSMLKHLSHNKNRKMVVTSPFGNEGSASILFDENMTDVYLKYKDMKDETFRTSRYIENSIGVATNLIVFKDCTYVAPITQQKLDGLKYIGGFYPANIGNQTRNKIQKYCLEIGEKLRSNGYLGLCGVDFIVYGDYVALAELNPRKTGTAVAVSKMLTYSLSVLEYLALKREKKPKVEVNKFKWEI